MKIPDYINNKGNIVRLIIFTALFALVFINIYKPFSSSHWYNVSEFMFFVYSSLIILTGVLVVIISRIIMYLYSRRYSISYIKYGVWVLLEILFMALFYTLYTMSVNDDPSAEIMATFKNCVVNTALVLLLPYAFFWFYFGWKENQKKLESINNKEAEQPNKPIVFKDEKGVIQLYIPATELLYIEAADNYVNIRYVSNGKIKSYLLRNSLINMERQLVRNMVVRCHRSYLVNINRVSVIRREKEHIYMELDIDGAERIPVSKNYQKDISSRFISA